ncbi:MAG: DUF3795 domain-containing protein [Acutalibacter sp.]|nr:DUF3795 domain-containing protein [Acutalibacter sp.]
MEIFAKCGMRCDLCLLYRPNVEALDRRVELVDAWKRMFDFQRDPAAILCDGCGCQREDAEYFDKDCRTRACVLEKGYEHCGFCESYPCEIFPAEPSPEEIRRKIEVEKVWRREDEALMEVYHCKMFMDEFREKHHIH